MRHAPGPRRHRPGRRGRCALLLAMTHDQALTVVASVLEAAPGPVSVVVVDTHGEVVASVAMTGAARDTYLNAQRKAYTAARSDAFTTRQLAEKAGGSPTELASFDPRFSFFLGGVAAFRDGARGRGRSQRPSRRGRRAARLRRRSAPQGSTHPSPRLAHARATSARMRFRSAGR